MLERRDVDLRLKEPGFLVDIVVSADVRTLTRVWMGDARLPETVRAGLIRLDGPRSPPAQHSDPLEVSSPAALDLYAGVKVVNRAKRFNGVDDYQGRALGIA